VGFDHKTALLKSIQGLGHHVVDVGGDSAEPNDYPVFALRVAEAVTGGDAEVGILLCGTGIGMSIVANKVKGIRAALCHDAFTVKRARGHNNANVLAMGALVVSIPHACELAEAFLSAPFEAGRHVPRLQKIDALERSRGTGQT
jgi:RpiB/LacA/LacB family sugar-phosphate isomerase